jgi:alpha-mannosidase
MSLTIDILPLPLLRKGDVGFLQSLRVAVTRNNEPVLSRSLLTVRRGSWKADYPLEELPYGSAFRHVLIPEPVSQTDTVFAVTCGDDHGERTIRMGRVRRWTVHLVLHSHTDLGFTAPLSDVVRIHDANTDSAISYCKETADWPEACRFKWTCEVSWQVQKYLRNRLPARFEELMQCVREESIAVGALYSGELPGLLGHEEAVRSLSFAAYLRRSYGIPCDTALLCDVPGSTQGFVQILARGGVRNLIIADNNFIAPFLVRTDLPRPFLWEGAAGSRLLTWYTDHPFYAYVEGEYYGFHKDIAIVEEVLPRKLHDLEASGYAYDRFQIQYAFDNAPITFRPAEIVRSWNNRWSYPRIVLSTAREFLETMRKDHGSNFPSRSGDWSDWWGGIVTGFPREETLTRSCHRRVPEAEFLATQVSLRDPSFTYPGEELNTVYDGLLAFDEHSGGGAVWRPESAEQQARAVREGYGSLYDAERTLGHEEDRSVRSLARLISNPGPNSGAEKRVVAFNGSPFPVSGVVVPEKGMPVVVEDIPAYGYRTFSAGGEGKTRGGEGWAPWDTEADPVLENGRYRLVLDKQTGHCRSLFDKRLAREIIRPETHLNEAVVYVPRMIKEVELGKYIPEIYDGRPHPGGFLPWPTASGIRLEKRVAPGGGLRCRVSHLFGEELWLSQEYGFDPFSRGLHIANIVPRAVRDNPRLRSALKDFFPAAGHLYFRFAFSLTDAVFEYESTGMIIRPREMQFKGACRDYFPIQRWCRIAGESTGIVVSAPDTPLVDVGSVGLYRFKEQIDEDESQLFFRAVNFRDWGSDVESPFSKSEDCEFRFALDVAQSMTSGPDDIARSRVEAARFAARAFPLISTCPIPSGQQGGLPPDSHAFLRLDPDHVEVMTLKRAESGDEIVLRVRETAGKGVVAAIEFPGLVLNSVRRALTTEEPLNEVPLEGNVIRISLQPFAIETLLISAGEYHG